MACTIRSQHQKYRAAWLDLTEGQIYRLKVCVWEVQQGQAVPAEGTVVFKYGKYQQAFDEAGGVAAAVNGITLTVDEERQSDIAIEASSKRDMYFSLELSARNGRTIGEPYAVTAPKDMTIPDVRLITFYCFT